MFAILVASMPACDSSPAYAAAPEWIELAGLAGGPAVFESDLSIEVAGQTFRHVKDDEGDWLSRNIENASLKKVDEYRFTTRTVARPIGSSPTGPPNVRLRQANQNLRHVPLSELVTLEEAPSDSFAFWGERLHLQHRGESFLEQLRLEYSLAHGRLEDGRWMVRGHRFTGEGFSVLPGAQLTRRLDIPKRSALRLATCAEPFELKPTQRVSVRFRVLLDSKVLLDHKPGPGNGRVWHTLELPEEGAQDAELRFEVQGDFAYTSFLAPVIGPLDPVPSGPETLPDIVLFVADTFRADNMQTYGGALDLTPNLDSLAQRALVFTQARSVSTHTLPSHASLFTGLYPLQTGVWGFSSALPTDVQTLAESLAAAGYRTGAITGSGIVSHRFGMAQGFQYFDEHVAGIDSTVHRARSFLNAGDGRPTFLFVQSYETHAPYTVRDDTRSALEATLGIEGDYEHWKTKLEHALETDAKKKLQEPEAIQALEGLRKLYLGGVADFDKSFADLVYDMDGRGFFNSGFFLFTSDHGEAFGEHDDFYHGGPVHEEQVLVPLLLVGPGITPGLVDEGASLIDVMPTILALAKLPVAPWLPGSSLLDLKEERPLYLYQCARERQRATVGMLRGPRKIICSYPQLEEGVLGLAFDLARDPYELEEVEREEWPRQLFELLRPDAIDYSDSRFEAGEIQLDEQATEHMRALGYVE